MWCACSRAGVFSLAATRRVASRRVPEPSLLSFFRVRPRSRCPTEIVFILSLLARDLTPLESSGPRRACLVWVQIALRLRGVDGSPGARVYESGLCPRLTRLGPARACVHERWRCMGISGRPSAILDDAMCSTACVVASLSERSSLSASASHLPIFACASASSGALAMDARVGTRPALFRRLHRFRDPTRVGVHHLRVPAILHPATIWKTIVPTDITTNHHHQHYFAQICVHGALSDFRTALRPEHLPQASMIDLWVLGLRTARNFRAPTGAVECGAMAQARALMLCRDAVLACFLTASSLIPSRVFFYTICWPQNAAPAVRWVCA